MRQAGQQKPGSFHPVGGHGVAPVYEVPYRVWASTQSLLAALSDVAGQLAVLAEVELVNGLTA